MARQPVGFVLQLGESNMELPQEKQQQEKRELTSKRSQESSSASNSLYATTAQAVLARNSQRSALPFSHGRFGLRGRLPHPSNFLHALGVKRQAGFFLTRAEEGSQLSTHNMFEPIFNTAAKLPPGHAHLHLPDGQRTKLSK